MFKTLLAFYFIEIKSHIFAIAYISSAIWRQFVFLINDLFYIKYKNSCFNRGISNFSDLTWYNFLLIQLENEYPWWMIASFPRGDS